MTLSRSPSLYVCVYMRFFSRSVITLRLAEERKSTNMYTTNTLIVNDAIECIQTLIQYNKKTHKDLHALKTLNDCHLNTEKTDSLYPADVSD